MRLQPGIRGGLARTLTHALLLAAVWSAALLCLQMLTPSGHAAPRTSTDATADHGTLLIAVDHRLLLRNAATGVERTLLQFSQDEFVRSPVWLPDGSGFLFIDQRAYTGDRSADYGGDIWQVAPDGSNAHVIWRHDAKGADIDGLTVAPDGSFLIFGYTLTQLSSSGAVTGQIIQIRRYDITAQHVSLVIDQASSPALSPDGSTIAYLNVAEADNNDFGLWLCNVDGSNPRPLVTLAQNLLGFFAPRFSPNGSTLLFAGIQNPGFPLNVPTPSGRAPARNRPVWAAPVASADGPPQDIWSVALDGTGLQRLTQINEDQPSAAWSSDGRQIAVFGSTGFYLLNADGTGFARLGDGYLHGQIAWRDP
jgi:Tol biopolymer transport system component